jgi:gamma-glutamyltranspeptidase/glutathione hydrolase
VACGNADTAAAAVSILRSGGNAVDAAVAGGFAAALTEPGLTSLGGGGFMLLRQADGTEHLLDFFVDAPGRGLPEQRLAPHFTPITVVFSGAEQVFHAGYGSVGVPGVLDGYLHAHRRFGRLPLSDVLAPARRMAVEGVPLAPTQATVLDLLHDILTLTDEARAVFAPNGTLPVTGDALRNESYAHFLGELAPGRASGWRDAPHSQDLVDAMASHDGLVTREDLEAYRVIERAPLSITYRGVRITTNPAPSFGGSIVADALVNLGRAPYVSEPTTLAATMMRELHAATERGKRADRARSAKGTTHLSVVDGDGVVVSMTTSNGSCSGVVADHTGVQLNNMMGESDLHPDGFHLTEPGTRIGSMMAPMIVDLPDGRTVAMGSGGSERIRSALMRVVVSLAGGGIDLEQAVNAPRMHHDGSVIQVEPGLRTHTLAALADVAPVNQWSDRDLYFGGVHAVSRAADGTTTAVGDPRRDGAGRVVSLSP